MATLGGGRWEEEAADVEELSEDGDLLDTFNDETFGGDLPAKDFELDELADQTAALTTGLAPAAAPLKPTPWGAPLPGPSQEALFEASISHLIEDDEDPFPRLPAAAPDPSKVPSPGGLFGAPIGTPFLDAYRDRNKVWAPPAAPAQPQAPSNGSARMSRAPAPKTLAEIEAEMMARKAEPPRPQGGDGPKTLAEIEAEMLAKAAAAVAPAQRQQLPGVMSLEDLERQLLHKAPSPPPPLPMPGDYPPLGGYAGGDGPPRYPGPPQHHPQQPHLQGGPQGPVHPLVALAHQIASAGPPRGPMTPPPWAHPQFQMALRAHIASGKPHPPGLPPPHVLLRFLAPHGPPPPHPGGPPPHPGLRMAPPPPFTREVGTNGPLQHQMRGPPPPGYWAGPPGPPPPGYRGPPPPGHPDQFRGKPQPGRRMFADLINGPYGGGGMGGDPYAGLMSRREKEWLTKIHMMQLETENPYQDDYYFTMLQNRAFAEERRREGKAEVEPFFAVDEPDHTPPPLYVPPKLEGSLGKIPHLSMNFPRQLIDVTSGPKESSGRSTPAAQRPASPVKEERSQRRRLTNLMHELERMWDVLLSVEEKRLSLAAVETEEQKAEVQAEMAKGKASLLARMELDRLPIYLSINKGRSLVGRLLLLMTRAEAAGLLGSLLSLGQSLTKRDRESGGRALAKALLPGTVEAAKRLSKQQLGELLGQLSSTFLEAAAAERSRFGLCLPLVLLCHASRHKVPQDKVAKEGRAAVQQWVELFVGLAEGETAAWRLVWLRTEHVSTLCAWLHGTMDCQVDALRTTLGRLVQEEAG